jgi:RNA polymerase sigma factor for flagellar operon FliA
MSPPRPEADSPEVLARLHEALTLAAIVVKQAPASLQRRMGVDELEAYAREGALLAARSFDPSREVPFRRWASIRMRGAVLDGVRRSGNLPRRMRETLRSVEASLAVEETMAEEDAAAPPSTPEAADARLDDYLAVMATALASGELFTNDPEVLQAIEDESPSPEDRALREELARGIRDALRSLPEKERTILEKHFLEGMTLEQAGAAMGLSRSWTCRLHARAMVQITKVLQHRAVTAA